jgi:hypothetical protein
MLREGSSWNLWNRVVAEGDYDPNTSKATFELRKKLNDSTFVANNHPWWFVTSQLSQRGMQPREIQDYCTQVCLDGIQDDPLKYIATTLERGLWALPTVTIETSCIFPEHYQYPEFIKERY